MVRKKLRIVRYGVKTKDGIVLLGHEGLPLMVKTEKEAKKTWRNFGDKIIKIVLEEK